MVEIQVIAYKLGLLSSDTIWLRQGISQISIVLIMKNTWLLLRCHLCFYHRQFD